MAKQKDSSDDNSDLDLIEDGEVGNDEFSADVLELEEQVESEELQKVNHKLEVKKRLDAYLERKWLKESGWDDDDELFQDEFFDEDSV